MSSPVIWRAEFRTHLLMGIGALVWWVLDLPLAWMLGPATVGLVFAMRNQPVTRDRFFGDIGRGLLGVAIGATITGQHFLWMATHPELMVGLVVYVGLAGLIGFLWLYRVCRWDATTAWFSAFPGGLSEMIASAQHFGGNISRVALAHSLRVFCLVAGASVVSRLFAGINTGALSFGEVSWAIQPWTAVAILSGIWLGRRLKVPAPTFMGPLIVSLALNLTVGLVLRLPDVLMIVGQYLIGWSIAARFIGVTRDEVTRTLKQVFVSLLSMVPVWIGMAVILDYFTEVDLQSLVLGLAPGGQAEIALLAIAMDANMAVVMLLHVFRVFLIISFGSMIFVLIRKRLARQQPE